MRQRAGGALEPQRGIADAGFGQRLGFGSEAGVLGVAPESSPNATRSRKPVQCGTATHRATSAGRARQRHRPRRPETEERGVAWRRGWPGRKGAPGTERVQLHSGDEGRRPRSAQGGVAGGFERISGLDVRTSGSPGSGITKRDLGSPGLRSAFTAGLCRRLVMPGCAF